MRTEPAVRIDGIRSDAGAVVASRRVLVLGPLLSLLKCLQFHNPVVISITIFSVLYFINLLYRLYNLSQFNTPDSETLQSKPQFLLLMTIANPTLCDCASASLSVRYRHDAHILELLQVSSEDVMLLIGGDAF